MPRARCKDPESCKSSCAGSAAPRTRPPALGRGLLLASSLDVGSHPPPAQAPAQSPRVSVVPRGFFQGSRGARPSGGPRWSNLCWIPGWGSGGVGVGTEPQSRLHTPCSPRAFPGRVEEPEPGSSPPDVGLPLPRLRRLSWREAHSVPRPTPSATLFFSCHSLFSVSAFSLLQNTRARGTRRSRHTSPFPGPPISPSPVLSLPRHISVSIDSPRSSLPV